MSTLSELAHIAAETLPYWRDGAIMVLALVVIAALTLYVSVLDG